jgi:hypothetical protein
VLRCCLSCFDVTQGEKLCRCGTVPPYLTVGTAAQAIRALQAVRDLIWPGGKDTAQHPAEVLDAIVRALAFMKPGPLASTPRRGPLRSVPR